MKITRELLIKKIKKLYKILIKKKESYLFFTMKYITALLIKMNTVILDNIIQLVILIMNM